MKISTKAWFATCTALATIALIAVITWYAVTEVYNAEAQRRQTAEIGRALNGLRLVTFEYLLLRPERARLQEQQVAARMERLLDASHFTEPEAARLLADLRERNATAKRLVAELAAARADETMAEPAVMRRFEAQISNRLLLLHQESLADAFQLNDFSSARIDAAQRGLMTVIFAGLALVAVAIGVATWLLQRKVLLPVRRLEEATREVAAGNWNYELGANGNGNDNDEIGEMSRNFNAMTRALRDSFAQIQRSNQELAALNKEIEAFSYSVSHDLRAPLRSMDGFSLALLEDYGDKLDEEARDSLRRIRAASQRMGRLIDELLGLSRVTRTELAVRAVNLSAIAHEIAESLQQREPERQVHWDIEDGIVVQADKGLTQIALQNLLENAWKFTSKTDKAQIRVGTAQHNGRNACFVADNGVGFDMTYADRLFGAFQRLHHENEFSGTGIGLAIVHRIIRRHEGKIWVQAQPGRGATFYFNFRDEKHDGTGQDHPPG